MFLYKSPKPILMDKHCSRFVGMEVNLYGIKTLILGIYDPNEDVGLFYKVWRDWYVSVIKTGVW